jgi:polyphosphate kinase 2 (PPK2 family)
MNEMTDVDEKPEAASGKLKEKDYQRELARLHVEMVKLQLWAVHERLRVCILFEGRDGAGKGGAIKAITERVSPRVFRVVALPEPTEREKSQIYFQRYIRHLPSAGEIVIFDRSWYNRAGVERVMGFCTEKDVEMFLEMVPLVEKAARKSRRAAWKPASMMDGRFGNSRQWTCSRTAVGTIIPAPGTQCSAPRICPGPLGMSFTRMTKIGLGSTLLLIC